MKTLSELRTSDLAKVELIAFDVDDTLTRDGVLEPEAFNALCALKQKGFRLIAATGRPLGWAQALAAILPVDAAVGENGAGYYARQTHHRLHALANTPLSAERVREALEQAEIPFEPTSDAPFRLFDTTFNVGEQRPFDANYVASLESALQKAGYRTRTSSIHVHASLAQFSKAQGILAASQELWPTQAWSAQNIAYVGDAPNDSEAFACFEQTFGVANIEKHKARISHLPRYISSLSHGKGFAEIAARFLEGRP